MALIPVTVFESSDTVPAGQVIRTDPVAGADLEDGDTITIYVSLGAVPARFAHMTTKTAIAVFRIV